MDLKAANRQVNRFASLHGWDKLEQSGREELVIQMGLAFADEKTASAAVGFWLKENKWVPTPADIHQLAAQFEEKPQAPTDRDCELCSGSGFKQCWELHTYLGGLDRHNQPLKTTERINFERYSELRKTVDDVKQRVCEAVEACSCAYGQFLAAARRAERLRKEAEAHERRQKRG